MWLQQIKSCTKGKATYELVGNISPNSPTGDAHLTPALGRAHNTGEQSRGESGDRPGWQGERSLGPAFLSSLSNITGTRESGVTWSGPSDRTEAFRGQRHPALQDYQGESPGNNLLTVLLTITENYFRSIFNRLLQKFKIKWSTEFSEVPPSQPGHISHKLLVYLYFLCDTHLLIVHYKIEPQYVNSYKDKLPNEYDASSLR